MNLEQQRWTEWGGRLRAASSERWANVNRQITVERRPVPNDLAKKEGGDGWSCPLSALIELNLHRNHTFHRSLANGLDDSSNIKKGVKASKAAPCLDVCNDLDPVLQWTSITGLLNDRTVETNPWTYLKHTHRATVGNTPWTGHHPTTGHTPIDVNVCFCSWSILRKPVHTQGERACKQKRPSKPKNKKASLFTPDCLYIKTLVMPCGCCLFEKSNKTWR